MAEKYPFAKAEPMPLVSSINKHQAYVYCECSRRTVGAFVYCNSPNAGCNMANMHLVSFVFVFGVHLVSSLVGYDEKCNDLRCRCVCVSFVYYVVMCSGIEQIVYNYIACCNVLEAHGFSKNIDSLVCQLKMGCRLPAGTHTYTTNTLRLFIVYKIADVVVVVT